MDDEGRYRLTLLMGGRQTMRGWWAGEKHPAKPQSPPRHAPLLDLARPHWTSESRHRPKQHTPPPGTAARAQIPVWVRDWGVEGAVITLVDTADGTVIHRWPDET